MNEIREIVTKAVVGKGRKLIRLMDTLTPNNTPYSILGCWIINHEYAAALSSNTVEIQGSYEINIWYAYNNNTQTDIAKKTVDYSQTIRIRQIVEDTNSECRDVIVRAIQQPTCTNAVINDDHIDVDVIVELLAEVIGETKIKVTVFNQFDPCDPYEEEDFENQINEDFIQDNT